MKRDLAAMAKEKFDLVIVGGGISGAAIAREASLYGLKVALVDKNDFGSGTSAATSKLIHGGLRYLKNYEFGLVRESLQERAHLIRLAPHLVYPLPFLLPTYKHSTNSKFMVGIGMKLYDMLSSGYRNFKDNSKNLPAHKMLSPEEVMICEPKVYLQELTGGALYYDCLSLNPERLTLSFLLSAAEQGASLANYAQMTEFLRENQRVTGIKVQDQHTKEFFEIRGQFIINAGGPWSDFILEGTKSIKILRSQGIHLITKKINNSHAIALQTPSQRHYFIIPWRGRSLIGTTDKLYAGHPNEYKVEPEHILEFMEEVNTTYDAKLTPEDIYFSYGGLRPLADTQAESYKASRKYEIEDHEKDGVPGLLSVLGGKYTTSRQLAENVLKIVGKKLKKSLNHNLSRETPLYGGDIPLMEPFVENCLKQHSDLDPVLLERICRDRGTSYSKIIELIPTAGSLFNAEILYSIREEMAQTLNDIIFRRIALATTGKPNEIEDILNYAGKELNWDETEKAKQLMEFQNQYQNLLSIS